MDVFHESTGDLPREKCNILLTLELDGEHFETLLDAIFCSVLS